MALNAEVTRLVGALLLLYVSIIGTQRTRGRQTMLSFIPRLIASEAPHALLPHAALLAYRQLRRGGGASNGGSTVGSISGWSAALAAAGFARMFLGGFAVRATVRRRMCTALLVNGTLTIGVWDYHRCRMPRA